MFDNNRITKLFSIQYPIIQGGMVWCSGWELVAAISNAGGLGLIGSGSMTPDVLRIHIQKTQQATHKPFGVNVPLIYHHAEDNIKVIIEEKVPIVFTSAGNPAKWTKLLQQQGIKVAHVVSNLYFAKKCVDAGVDAIVAEGVEAGGHNGKEENTTMVLIPLIKKYCSLPLIAAGGITSGRSMLAALVLGAEGVQIGTRFVASNESSAHHAFKQKILETNDGDTRIAMRKISPIRIIHNHYSEQLLKAENMCLSNEELLNIRGKERTKKGMFEGDIVNGELEIGQAASTIDNIKPAKEIVEEIIQEFCNTLKSLKMI